MKYKITIDVETRSSCDLTQTGGWIYSKDSSTDLLCLAYTISDNSTGQSNNFMYVPPRHLVKYLFNLHSSHKGLLGHFSRVKGKNLVRPVKATKDLWDTKQDSIFPVQNIINKSGVNRGWSWQGEVQLKSGWHKTLRMEKRPTLLLKIIEQGNYELEAHNAFFEKSIWENVLIPKYEFPAVEYTKWSCSAALAAYHNLPRALDKVGVALNLPVKKDESGKIVMLQMSKPKQDGTFYDDPQRWSQLLSYCRDDVLCETEISKKLGTLPEQERAVWLLDQKINRKGVPVDIDLVNGGISIIESYTKYLEDKMAKLTNGKLTNIRQVANLKLWLEEHKILTDSVDKNAIIKILERKNLPDKVREVLTIRQRLGQTSTAKYYKFKSQYDPEDRTIKDQFLYAGAGPGRWSGRGAQIQNLPRGSIKQTAEMLDDIKGGKFGRLFMYGDPMDVLSSCVRGIISDKNKFIMDADFSNIEGRITAWIAKEDWKIQAFKDFDNGTGHDLYCVSYSKSFDIPVEAVNPDQRQVGKATELSLGFGGGLGAFHNMAKVYGVFLPDNQAQDIIRAWRDIHPSIVSFWYALEQAAKMAVQTGAEQKVNEYISYGMEKDFLYCKLPSGRKIYYYKPLIEMVETQWGSAKQAITYQTSKGNSTFRVSLWHGLLCENLVQGTARDVLCHSMLLLDSKGYDIRMHVHDSILSITDNINELKEYETLMATVPSWAEGLPIAVEGFVASNFRK